MSIPVQIEYRYMPPQPVVKLKPVTVARVRANRPTFTRAMQLLRLELAHLGAERCVLEAGYKQIDIRNDGFPRSSARPEHGQVRVFFSDKADRKLSFMQTGWKDFDWNLYTIGMLLKYLRDADVYACDARGQQYAGYAQLPPGKGIEAQEFASVEDAMRWLSIIGDGDIHSALAADIDVVYKQAAKKAHPDSGGSTDLMAKVNRARDFVEELSGVKG